MIVLALFILFAGLCLSSGDLQYGALADDGAVEANSYQAQVDTIFTPRVPRSILYYAQDLGHKWYDTPVTYQESVERAQYMGFELISPKRFRFNYHLNIPKGSLDPALLINVADSIAKATTKECPRFTNLLPEDQTGLIKGCETTVTLLPLQKNCSPHQQFDTENNPVVIYPCGFDSCQKCSSTKPCRSTKDCMWGTDCVENICGMITAQSTQGVSVTIVVLFLVSYVSISLADLLIGI